MGDRSVPRALEQAAQLLGSRQLLDARVREAAWVARCVGRGETAPLTAEDVSALATALARLRAKHGAVVFAAGDSPDRVWILRQGRLELSVGSGRRRVVVHLLHPGDVDGDIELLLDMPLPYTARALDDAVLLVLNRADFERLLVTHPPIARRWLSSVAQRLAASQGRILGLLGRSLTKQVARLLLDEAVDSRVLLPQRTLAAMLGVQRPSINKVLKDFERDGLIAIRYATIELLNTDGLAREAT